MPTERMILEMTRSHGFRAAPRQGVVGLIRARPDGLTQGLGIFWWRNKKIADARGIPYAYLVLCPALDGISESGRYRIPLVEWPSENQPTRGWGDVAAEFREVFMPILDAPVDIAMEALEQIDQSQCLRHVLGATGRPHTQTRGSLAIPRCGCSDALPGALPSRVRRTGHEPGVAQQTEQGNHQ